MSTKWRVYNMHRDGLTHKEKFKDELIEIPYGKYVLMDYEDAVQFRGQYFPMKMDAQGVQDPTTYKMIKIEADSASSEVTSVKKFISPMDGKEFHSQHELDAYIEAKYGDIERVKDESLDAEIEKQAEMQKRKPGRPPAKEKSA